LRRIPLSVAQPLTIGGKGISSWRQWTEGNLVDLDDPGVMKKVADVVLEGRWTIKMHEDHVGDSELFSNPAGQAFAVSALSPVSIYSQRKTPPTRRKH
jgi:hypothetical protein